MNYIKDGNDILLQQSDFDIDQIFNCGQTFRWEKINSNSYKGYFFNKPLEIGNENGTDLFRFHNTSEEDFLDIWANYFDLFTDYGEIKECFSEDETLSKACEFAGGIRILNQDSWEMLSSFILSQNNNIPRIKGIISNLVEHYGKYPTALEMADETEESLEYLHAGFRAKYLVDAIKKVNSGEIDLKAIRKMDIEDARKTLQTINGVGPKVADCTLLFGFNKTEAFPRDVWVNRVMEKWYPDGLPSCTKGREGIAQQYLFHYIRHLEQ